MKITITKNAEAESLISKYIPSELVSYYCVYQSESLRTGFDADQAGAKMLAELACHAWHWDFNLKQFVKISSPDDFLRCLRKNLSTTVHKPNDMLLSEFDKFAVTNRRLKQDQLRTRLGKLSKKVIADTFCEIFEEDKIKIRMSAVAFIAENSTFLLRWGINEFGLYCTSIGKDGRFRDIIKRICDRQNVVFEEVSNARQLPAH